MFVYYKAKGTLLRIVSNMPGHGEEVLHIQTLALTLKKYLVSQAVYRV